MIIITLYNKELCKKEAFMKRSEAEKSIEDIKRMLKETEGEVRRARKSYVDYQLVWGILVLVGIGLNILFLKLRIFAWITIGWFLLMGVGIFLSYRIGKRQFRETGITTFVSKVIVRVWLSAGIGMMLIVLFAYVSPGFAFVLIPAFLAILVGIALFVESFLCSWKFLSFVAPLWWIGAIIMAIYPENSLYFYAGLIVLTYIIPAILVKIKD
jgi:hypothetical protein